MSRREVAFLLIGLGSGLVFAAIAIIEFVLLWFHHMFIIGFQWRAASVVLVLPFLLVLLGLALLYHNKGERKSN